MSEENILLSRSRYDSIMERLAQFEEERKKNSEIDQLNNNEETTDTTMEKQVFEEEGEPPSDDDVKSSGRAREDIYQDNKDLLPPRGYVFNDNMNRETLDHQEKKRKPQDGPEAELVRASHRSDHQRKKKKPVKPSRTIKPWISLL